ncbi:uncharacterized protein Z518_03494 [Rhinocladiella mackenziei CBS 650.93]|uniref:Alpha/beta hydrolase fold-3 domain-containing protein n=1 Tax=Rhinocladiella mackenziei CBS 650.93 TaxID=1442369 RepID=A0A0D2G2R1_9EURO|nr:uncharacterized protein Z518_03494 [Rhinocladiella mackenziei CBS 650.93]KIX08837.1 hypothetical protein Z518_03494 [Rhinocladiella mackenziei CBS 650.93]
MDDLIKHPKYSQFEVHQTSYKRVREHEIVADVFIPRNLVVELSTTRGLTKVPIIVRFHGGGMFTGMSLYPEWFPAYLLEYAYEQAVPIISADYRLMPECKGLDILDDLSSFWDWLRASECGLQAFLSSLYPSLEIDGTRIIAEGESAGGYLVVQAALSGLPGLRAAIAAYPMLDLRAPYYTQKFEKVMTGVPMLPESIIDNHLETMKASSVVSSVLPPARGDLGTAVIQHGRFCEFLGAEDILYPVDRVNLGLYSALPKARLWIYHGKQDTGIPAAGSVEFVRQARELWPDSELRLDLPDGEHGFHKYKHANTTEWLKNGLLWVEKAWLPI